MSPLNPLAPDKLFRRCDPEEFTFETTADIGETTNIIGQARATSAIRFGVGMPRDGYNLFALGPHGMGKYETIRQFLEERAEERPVPPDICYVNNFEDSSQPRVLCVPAGRGIQLADDMDHLVEELFAVVPAAFESDDYQQQRQTITEEMQESQENDLEALNERAREEGIALLRTPQGLAFAPLKEDGEVVSPDEFRQLPEEKRTEIEQKVEELQEELQRIVRQMPQNTRSLRERLNELKKEIATFTISPLIEELLEQYGDLADAVRFLERTRKDLIENVDKIIQDEDEGQQMPFMRRQEPQGPDSPFFRRYKVNVLINHAESEGAPVVYEDHPTHQNLLGRIEYMSQMGTLTTDFSLIKPGALHRANGGYLLLDARRLLTQPYAYESLKRVLRSGKLRVESLGQTMGLLSTVSLEPEDLDLDVKVVLLGDRMLYYTLIQYDPEFSELFKVAADFEDEMDRNDKNNTASARLIASVVQEHRLRPLDRSAVARVIEYSSRHAGDAEKLSTHSRRLGDLVREADYWAGEEDREVVVGDDILKAVEQQRYRSGRIRDRMQESILRETILIDTSGEKVGQINGLAVLSLGDSTFGRPSRITARVRLGKGEVVDIERKVELSGPFHAKGVLILSAFLGARYAEDRPLSLSASLVFEQSYGPVDGDSASSTELYALLSALAETPIRQSLAVTGSVNQYGEVQAIGGVNYKIEGFFDICNERGLTGEQGVLIPQANVKNLMLRKDVVEAAEAGQFHIYAVSHIDQGIELLTGVPAGAPDEDGVYPEDTINRRVSDRLAALAEKRRELSQKGNGKEEA